MEIGVQGYIFDLMCPGAEVKGKVYNKVERSILLLTDGSATKSYRKLCQVYLTMKLPQNHKIYEGYPCFHGYN